MPTYLFFSFILLGVFSFVYADTISDILPTPLPTIEPPLITPVPTFLPDLFEHNHDDVRATYILFPQFRSFYGTF